MNKLIKWGTIVVAGMPFIVLAQSGLSGGVPTGARTAPVSSFGDVLRVLDQFIIWFQAILFVVAIIFILIAAFKFITGSDTAGARTMLVYAAIGIAIALLAFAVEPIVLQLLGG